MTCLGIVRKNYFSISVLAREIPNSELNQTMFDDRFPFLSMVFYDNRCGKDLCPFLSIQEPVCTVAFLLVESELLNMRLLSW